MRIRTKLLIGAGLLLLAVGVVVVTCHEESPAVTASFVRYESNGAVVLMITNLGGSTVSCAANDVELLGEQRDFVPDFDLLPRSVTQFVAVPFTTVSGAPTLGDGTVRRLVGHDSPTKLPAKISVFCFPQPSALGYRIQTILLKMGINIGSTGFVATVDLPPR